MNYVLYEGAKRGRAQVTEGMSLEKCYDYLQGRVYYSRRINSVFRVFNFCYYLLLLRTLFSFFWNRLIHLCSTLFEKPRSLWYGQSYLR